MSRLILIPQYPVKLRYQEWWIQEFIEQYNQYFDKVHVLGPVINTNNKGREKESEFSPVEQAIQYEIKQISEYMKLELHPDDILLLNDLSFPGLFASVLFHKRPKRCYAFCHATAKNKYDLFQPVRGIKYPVEERMAQLFDGVFVGSEYHARKLGWKNLYVTRLPNYPIWMRPKEITRTKDRLFACASRPSKQKVTKKIERALEKRYDTKIYRPNASSWEEYFQFLQTSKYLLITSKEETYGYQVVDALMNGCIPLAPRKYSYPELLSDRFLYRDYHELVSKIESWRVKIPHLELPKETFFATTAKIMRGQHE